MAKHKLEMWCDVCGEFTPLLIEVLRKDELNEKPWGDLVCKTCKLVHKAVRASVPGTLVFIPNEKVKPR